MDITWVAINVMTEIWMIMMVVRQPARSKLAIGATTEVVSNHQPVSMKVFLSQYNSRESQE